MSELSAEHSHKQSILERMSRFVGIRMGIKQNQLTDPKVLLMLEALAEEVYKISGELDNMEDRIQDKLADMLVRDVNAMPKPAQAILQAYPKQSNCRITPQMPFSLFSDHAITFFPVCNTPIFKARILYFINNGLFYSIDKTGQKTLITRNKKSLDTERNSFWIALQTDKTITDLCGFSFYIDFTNAYNKTNCLNLLPYSQWKIKDQTLSLKRGILNQSETDTDNSLGVFAQYNLSHQINDLVKKQYDPHFLSVAESFDITDKQELLPAKLKTCYATEFLEDFKEPLTWIEVKCPAEISDEAISSIQVSINTFAVVCKKLVSKSVELNPVIPIIPLHTDVNESFISVCSLTDSSGKQYYDVPLKENNLHGVYALRRGGCERYDKREAGQYLTDLLNRISKEASTFISSEAAEKSEMEQIQQDIKSILKGVYKLTSSSTDKLEVKNYILLNPDLTDKPVYFVNYWVTVSSAVASMNLLRTIHADPALPLEPDSIILLSSVGKGKSASEPSQKYAMYRKSITENRMLVTHADIKSFCLKQFSDSISEVQIRKGVVKSKDAAVGFINTTDVYLKPHKELGNYMGESDESYFCELLQKNSPFTFRYRVFIDKTN